MVIETLRADLERAFSDASEVSVVDRTGTGDHFQVTVATERFRGLSLVERAAGDREGSVSAPLHDAVIPTA